MLNAFHSNWTAPFFTLKKDTKYYIEDFEILTTMLSALEWRKNNGNIKMVTDEIGADYYRKLGIESIWNLGIDVSLDNSIIKEIDPKIFWAAGKIIALKNQILPSVMIDTDFIVWKCLNDKLRNTDLAAIHKEELNEAYPDKEAFKMREGYSFDKDLNWGIKPFNTAFVYINNRKFLRYYTDESLRFMKNLINSDDRLINMVFAEQRMFSMCAEKLNLKPEELMSLDKLTRNKQEYFTHIWGLKDRMRKDFSIRKKFCKRCILRIVNDFPQYEKNICDIKKLRLYYDELRSEKLNNRS